MAIGLNSLILEDVNLVSVMDSTTMDNECYLFSTISFLREMNEDFRTYNKKFYKSLYEAENFVAINESFGDFFEKIKDIIQRFIKYIRSLVDRFLAALHRLVGSEKYLLKNEDKLRKFNSDCEFEFEGYTFTIDPNIPICNALAEFNQSFLGIDFGDKVFRNRDRKAQKKYIKDLHDKLKNELDNDKYDKFRADVIGETGYIYQSEFGNELFQIFRDGYDNTSSFTVTSSVVNECFLSMKNYKTVEKEVKNKKKDIENQYKSIEKQIDHIISSNRENKLYNVDIDTSYDAAGSGNIKVDTNTMNELNAYVKTLVNQVTEMSTIHSMAFSYKLDALKDRYNQDKRILYIALNKVLKNKEIRREDI